jgi:hypothetical protein
MLLGLRRGGEGSASEGSPGFGIDDAIGFEVVLLLEGGDRFSGFLGENAVSVNREAVNLEQPLEFCDICAGMAEAQDTGAGFDLGFEDFPGFGADDAIGAESMLMLEVFDGDLGAPAKVTIHSELESMGTE